MPSTPSTPAVTRAIVIVMDSVGAGELPDAASYGDQGSNTLGNISAHVHLHVPTLHQLGLTRVVPLRHYIPSTAPEAAFGRMREASPGKDSVTGHWELMGLQLERAFPTFPTRVSRRPDRRVRAADRSWHTRQCRGLGDRDHGAVRRRAHADRTPHRLHVGRQRLPDPGARTGHPGRGAVCDLSYRLRARGRRPGRRASDCTAVRRRARALRPDRQPSRFRLSAAGRDAARPALGIERSGHRDRQDRGPVRGPGCAPVQADGER